jgi:DNA replication and repair protein RecF
MMVRRLELFHYRSYAHLTIEFNEKMNIILGENGSGKTNLVEAIHYLSLARSFRTNDDALLIQKNQPFAKIKATIAYQQTTKDVEIILSNEGKRVLMNHKQIQKLSQLSQVINVIIFEPKDVLIFDDFPKVRRKFIDIAISKHTPAYLDQITKYEQILKERNALLKYINPDRRHLTLLTQRLVEQSLPIVQARADYLRQINEVIAKIFTAIKGEKSTIE